MLHAGVVYDDRMGIADGEWGNGGMGKWGNGEMGKDQTDLMRVTRHSTNSS
jgi:hypothetical protein